jgi:hypothetical protein
MARHMARTIGRMLNWLTGTVVDGKTAIVQEHIDLWNGIFKGSHATGKVRRIRMLGSNYMIVDFDVEVSAVANCHRAVRPTRTALCATI